jgi:hypothetical protein
VTSNVVETDAHGEGVPEEFTDFATSSVIPVADFDCTRTSPERLTRDTVTASGTTPIVCWIVHTPDAFVVHVLCAPQGTGEGGAAIAEESWETSAVGEAQAVRSTLDTASRERAFRMSPQFRDSSL